MQILQLRVLAPLLALAVLSGVGCDDNGSTGVAINGTGPSPNQARSVSRGAMVQPAAIDVQHVGGGFCPNNPPFLAPFSVVFEGDGRSDLFLSNVQVQFVDTAGTRAGTMTFGPPELATRFGSTTLPAFGRRAFPFLFPFGCVGLPSGTLTVIARTRDSGGRESRTTTHVPVR
jgi:hypothetical protein